jgi:hypothetical protein
MKAILARLFSGVRIGRFGQRLAPGYSWCHRCLTPWLFVPLHDTAYSEFEGCFPLCEECWRELETPARRLPYYRELLAEWERMTPGYVTPEMIAAVKHAVFAEGETTP